MKYRRHLFEFCDQGWLPDVVRQTYMECLNFMHDLSCGYELLVRRYADWLASEVDVPVLDLASGGGNHIRILVRVAKAVGIKLPPIFLSDRFPQTKLLESWRAEASPLVLDYIKEPVLIDNIPNQRQFFRSLFSALHHLKPAQVQQLFADSIHNSKGLFIAEPFVRSWKDLILMPLGIPISMLYPFFAGLNARRVLLCCVFPIVPLLVAFDGIVSVLRCYRFDELLNLLPDERSGLDIQYGIESSGVFRRSMYFQFRVLERP